jgi:transcriptional regulator with XRE-family HTH domain
VSPITLRLKPLRERAGLSQNELAKLAGVAQSTVSRIEAGTRRDIGLGVLERLAKALGVSPRSLLGATKR